MRTLSQSIVLLACFALAVGCSPERRVTNGGGSPGEGEGEGAEGEGEGAEGEGEGAEGEGEGAEGEGEGAEGEGEGAEGEGEGAEGEGEGAEGEGEGAEGEGEGAEGEGEGAEGEGEGGEGEGEGAEGEGEGGEGEGEGPQPICEGCNGRRGIATGELEFIQVEGGCYALRDGDGRSFELIGPAAGRLLNRENVGRRFAISYRECEGVASFCQVGQIVCLESFDEVEGGGGGGGEECPEVDGGECAEGQQCCGDQCCARGQKCCPLRFGGVCVEDAGPCPVG